MRTALVNVKRETIGCDVWINEINSQAVPGQRIVSVGPPLSARSPSFGSVFAKLVPPFLAFLKGMLVSALILKPPSIIVP